MPKVLFEFDTSVRSDLEMAMAFVDMLKNKSSSTIETVADVLDRQVAHEQSVPRKKRVKRWSRKHESCVKCKSTERKHVAHGLCTTCYFGGNPSTYSELPGEINKRVVEERELMGKSVCSNPACPYDPIDYHPSDMVTGISGKKYCSKECENESENK